MPTPVTYTGDLPPARFNMARYCLGAAPARDPHKTALIVIDDADAAAPAQVWNYAQIEDAVLRIAGSLATAGLGRGDRILIRLANTTEYALLFFGAIAAGCVPIPAAESLSARDVTHLLADSGAAAIAIGDDMPAGDIPAGIATFAHTDIARFAAEGPPANFADTAADDPAFMIYTSGTTAHPKGVLHAHRAVWGRRPMYRGWYGIRPGDRILHAGAFNWTYTTGTGLSDPWANGATSLIVTGPKEPAVWPKLIAAHGVTMFAAVPSVYRQILKYGDVETAGMAALRHGLTAGEALPTAVADEWRSRAGTPLYEAFGMSELSTFISSGPNVPPKPGTIGRPQPGRAVVILSPDERLTVLPPGEPGLIASHISDPALMLGYWNKPDEEAEVLQGAWFCGGDQGVMDAQGYVTHLGRSDDLMNALGYRVSPLEVEDALCAFPGVAEVGAAEVRVRADVSVVGAFLVPEAGSKLDLDAVRAFASERLAAYKCPKEFVVVDALPRTPNGKIKRGELPGLYKGRA